MNLVPYERLTIKTNLSPEEAFKRLQDNVEPGFKYRKQYNPYGFRELYDPEQGNVNLAGNHRRFWKAYKPYQGEISESQFKVSRIIHYRSSFLPIIEGKIDPAAGGSSILITMHPYLLVTIFMIIWMGMAGLATLILLLVYLSALRNGAQSPPLPETLLPAGMLVFGWLMYWGGFKAESVKSKAFFRELFEAKQVEEFSILDLARRR